MKVYYQEYELYPATYNFTNEADGTSGTNIDFIDIEASNDSTYSAVITALEDGHRKIIKFDASGDNGKYARWQHNITNQPSGDIEVYVKYIDNGVGGFNLYFLDSGGSLMMYIIITSSDNTFRVYYGDGAGGHLNTSDACIADIWHHIRIHFDCATDTYSVWLNRILVSDDNNFYDDLNGAALDYYRFQLESGAGANALQAYLDAIGESWDANYNVGDNKFVDWHDPYNKVEITNIIKYPNPICRNEMVGTCSFQVRDFEGALFDFWYARDYNKVLVEDDNSNVLFRGFLVNKKFNIDSVTFFLKGIGVLLEWHHFYKDYILAGKNGLGKIRIVPATSTLTMYNDINVEGDGIYDGAAEDFGWNVDQWIFDRDVGLLVTDNTNDIDTEEWTCKVNPTTVNGTYQEGDKDSLDAPNDDDTYYVTDTGTSWDVEVVTTDIGSAGAGIADTQKLHKIDIHWRVGIMTSTGGVFSRIWNIKIYRDDAWEIIATCPMFSAIYNDYVWFDGVYTIPYTTDAELQKYLDKTGNDYDELKGLKVTSQYSGLISRTGSLKIDELRATIHYYTHEISPIMEIITDSTAETITCSGITKWDESGVKINDTFQIGQNTVQIVMDLAGKIGIPIDIIGQEVSSENTATLRPDGDSSVSWSFDDSGGTGDHFKDVDEVVVDPNAGDTNLVYTNIKDANEIFTMGTTGLPANNVVTKIELHTYGRRTPYSSGCNAYFYTTKLGYSSYQSCMTYQDDNYHWVTNTWSELALDQAELDSLLLKFQHTVWIMGGYVYMDLFYVVITYGIYQPFTKFMAREFKGTHCIDGLNAVCKLEGGYWCEDYINNRIKIIRPTTFEDSGISLTENDYDMDWEYEDKCNQVKRVDVWGKSAYNIHEYSEDPTVEGDVSKQYTDETITNAADAKEVADGLLAMYNTKRPSIKLTLNGTRPNLQLGYYINITFARPTITSTDYKIRMIERSERGIDGIKTIIHVGLGETKDDEKIGKQIRDIGYLAHKAIINKLL